MAATKRVAEALRAGHDAVLHPFGDHLQPQAVGERDDGAVWILVVGREHGAVIGDVDGIERSRSHGRVGVVEKRYEHTRLGGGDAMRAEGGRSGAPLRISP